MSQDELAQKVGASRSAVNAWERDRAWPRNLVALEQVLGIALDGEAARPEPPPWNVPVDQWEADTLAHPDMDDDTKRELITASRAARAAYAARHAASPGGSRAG
jgi:transcriptional regulator with XRE-family HTH domain